MLPLPTLDLGSADPEVREQLETARRQVDEGDSDGESVADSDADLAERYGDLGLLYLTYDFLDAAEVSLRNAVTLQGQDYRWPYLLGYLLVTRGQLEAALPYLQTSLERRADFLPAFLRLGRAHLALGQPKEAATWFERALELESEVAAAHEGLGRARAAAGQLDDAVGSFQRALELDPSASAVHYALAQVVRDLGDLDRARIHLEQSGDVTTRIVDPLINPLAGVALSVQFYLVQGAEALDDQNHAAAVQAYRSALELDAGSVEARRGLAAALLPLGDRDGARQALLEGLAVVAETLQAEGEDSTSAPSEASAEPRQALADLYRDLGRLASQDGNDRQAIGDYRQSLLAQPQQPGVQFRLANALARQAQFEDAIAVYDALIEGTPQWAPALWERRALAWVNLGQREPAVADFERALEVSPEDSRLRRLYADALRHLESGNEGDGTSTEPRRSSQGAPEGDVSTLLAEAREQVRRQEFSGAIESFRQILAAEPQLHDVRRELADVLGHTRQYDDALAEYGHVLQAVPEHEAAHRGRVVALILSGRLGEGRLALQDALRAYPRHRGLALTQIRLLAMSPDERVRDGSLALRIAQRVHQDRDDMASRQALALALAAAGDFAGAADLQRHVVALAEGQAPEAWLELERARLAAFEQGQGWTAQTADEILVALGLG